MTYTQCGQQKKGFIPFEPFMSDFPDAVLRVKKCVFRQGCLIFFNTHVVLNIIPICCIQTMGYAVYGVIRGPVNMDGKEAFQTTLHINLKYNA